MIAGSIAGGSLALMNKERRQKLVGKMKGSGENLLDSHPKAKNAAAATVIGKTFYHFFENVRKARKKVKWRIQEKTQEAKENVHALGNRLQDKVSKAKEEVKDNLLNSDDSDSGVKKPSDIPKATKMKGSSDIKGVNQIKSVT